MTTITTINAATQAGVTVDTIRAWCRTGVVTATKRAGRWIIDTASLAYRIKLPALLRRTPKPTTLTADVIVALGGRRWQKNGMDRIYINDWSAFAGLDVAYYGTGNISSASWHGERISNSQARLILGSLTKVWFDVADGKLHGHFGHTDSRVADRDAVWTATTAGIRTAAAAL
ncbi:hypothetical protein [Kitasatospora sp. NPDC127116]|uniref:hypothetical protein n=1 Tax=Kitasatospora sp. NPDC127116 TaxID=3345367 RepID=UPI00363B6473